MVWSYIIPCIFSAVIFLSQPNKPEVQSFHAVDQRTLEDEPKLGSKNSEPNSEADSNFDLTLTEMLMSIVSNTE